MRCWRIIRESDKGQKRNEGRRDTCMTKSRPCSPAVLWSLIFDLDSLFLALGSVMIDM